VLVKGLKEGGKGTIIPQRFVEKNKREGQKDLFFKKRERTWGGNRTDQRKIKKPLGLAKRIKRELGTRGKYVEKKERVHQDQEVKY